jgi:hypothetical protein
VKFCLLIFLSVINEKGDGGRQEEEKEEEET